MKGKIDELGRLWIERKGEMKQMHCAKRHDHLCCDLCPLFGEIEGGRDSSGYIGTGIDSLRLCQTTIHGDITDERGRSSATEEAKP